MYYTQCTCVFWCFLYVSIFGGCVFTYTYLKSHEPSLYVFAVCVFHFLYTVFNQQRLLTAQKLRLTFDFHQHIPSTSACIYCMRASSFHWLNPFTATEGGRYVVHLRSLIWVACIVKVWLHTPGPLLILITGYLDCCEITMQIFLFVCTSNWSVTVYLGILHSLTVCAVKIIRSVRDWWHPWDAWGHRVHSVLWTILRQLKLFSPLYITETR